MMLVRTALGPRSDGKRGIPSMSITDDERRQAVALFRHGVIAVVLCEPPERAGELIRLQSGKLWAIPGSSRIRVGETTIRDWIRLYGERGFDGLLPKRRRDQAKPRRMPPEVIDAVLSIKGDTPELSVRQVIRRARASGEIPADVPLPPSTLHRLFAREGLMVREQAGVRQANSGVDSRCKSGGKEGVTSHFCREPCVGSREGMGEASVAERVGRANERRNS